MKNIIVVGGGGREHAVIKKLKESPEVGVIYALPGNGGMAGDAECVPIAATDIDVPIRDTRLPIFISAPSGAIVSTWE